MKKFIAGVSAGLVLAVTGTGVAAIASDRDWRHVENDGVLCSIGKYGSSVETSGVCVMVSDKFPYSVSMDSGIGIKVENDNGRVIFKRGNWNH